MHVPINGSWPLYFGTASHLAWVGVVFLGAEGVVGILLERRRQRPPVEQPSGPSLVGGNGSQPEPSSVEGDGESTPVVSPPYPGPCPAPAPAPVPTDSG